ncbi:24497_t:CDS:2, partial [Dentiscutata erythropus]
MNQYLKKALDDGYINSIDYDSFSDIEEVKQEVKSEVFKAYWNHSGQVVALKTFDIFPVGNDCSSFEEFIRKFQSTQVIKDNNVAKFYGVSKGQIKHFMILEYAKDGNLRDYLRQNFKNLDWKKKISIGKQIANGLKAIHDQNIAHRDLNKPEHEIPVPDTPERYQLLYQQAWSFHPQERPSIEYINVELDEMPKNSKTSFFSKPQDLFGKKPKNFVSSSVNSSAQINSDNFSTQIHSDNANIIHHRAGSESTNPSVSKIIPEINDRNSGPPLPKKPSYIDTNQET